MKMIQWINNSEISGPPTESENKNKKTKTSAPVLCKRGSLDSFPCHPAAWPRTSGGVYPSQPAATTTRGRRKKKKGFDLGIIKREADVLNVEIHRDRDVLDAGCSDCSAAWRN
jgi:hypothetical protein